MAVSPDETLKAGDVLTIEATVRWINIATDGDVAVTAGRGSTFYVPRSAIISVRPVISPGDLVEHATNGREGVVRHAHEYLAWVAWTGSGGNTVTPVADLRRLRTAAEMAAVDVPETTSASPLDAEAGGETGVADTDGGVFG